MRRVKRRRSNRRGVLARSLEQEVIAWICALLRDHDRMARLALRFAPRAVDRTVAAAMARRDATIIPIDAPVQRIRRGRELRLVVAGEHPAPIRSSADPALVALLADVGEARLLVTTEPTRSINQIAAARGRCRKRLTMLVKPNWLAPDIVKAILTGQQAGDVDTRRAERDLPIDRDAQRRMLLVG